MEAVNDLFLQALRASLQRKTVEWEEALTTEQWQKLFTMASAHHVLPMIYDAVIRSGSARMADQQIFLPVKQRVKQMVVLQTIRTDALLKLLPELCSAGVTPLVVKGIICRELYPNPDYRASGDEDLFIPADQFELCHACLLANGISLTDPQQDLNDFEIPYDQKASGLHIELHKHLFSPRYGVYGKFNHYFAHVHQQSITQTVHGVPVPTMNHTDHLFYLICHSFKHFLHSGFGIRQVCDICLYADAFGSMIDWERIRKQCEEIRADLFAVALFRIGERHLRLRIDRTFYPEEWNGFSVDEIPMLEDLLEAGVFGSSTMSRMHSSNLTLNAVSDPAKRNRGTSVLKTVFPSAGDLSGRYPFLKGRAYLLPLAWADRILKYSRETASGSPGNNAAESLKIGSKRIELFKQYGIIDR